ncbi:MAG: SDR family oxidoreductase [Chitinophagaceae bacterium]
MSFQNKTIFITGASRGIGKAIALRLAKEGANIVIAAKSIEENPRLGGTIFSSAHDVEVAGGKALPIQLDIRNDEQIQQAVQKTIDFFGGIDVLINNASAIQLSTTEQTEAKRFDLLFDVNVRGTFMITKACIPFLKQATNAHILTLSPPINLNAKWLAPHVAYTLTKYNMTMMALGWAEEFKKHKIASNTIWPRTTIATAAIQNLLGGNAIIKKSRKPEIVADAVFHILSNPSDKCTGNCFIDEEILKKEGIIDFKKYAVNSKEKLFNDLFI